MEEACAELLDISEKRCDQRSFSMDLKKLEYRGYDSAGLAVFSGGEIQVRQGSRKTGDTWKNLIRKESDTWVCGYWAHPLGDTWCAFCEECPSACGQRW